LSGCFSSLLEDEFANAGGGFSDIHPEGGGTTRDVVVRSGCCSNEPALDGVKNPLTG